MKINLDNETIMILIKQILFITKLKCFFENNTNAVIKLKNNSIIIIGSSVDMDCICYIPILHNYQDYEKLIDIKKFISIIKNLYGIKNIDLIFLEKKICIQNEKLQFNLPVNNVTNFYYNTNFKSNNSISIESNKLKKLIDAVKCSVAINDVRSYLNGIFISIKNNKIQLVTSDGYRLSSISDIIANNINDEINIILHKTLILEVLKVISNTDIINIDFNDKKIQFKINNLVIITKSINSNFPDFNFLVKKNYCYFFIIEKEILLRSCLRMSILSNEKNFGINFFIHKDLLIISSDNQQLGISREQIQIKFNFNIKINFIINYKYIIDVLNSINNKQIKISISDDYKYLLINQNNQLDNFYILTTINHT